MGREAQERNNDTICYPFNDRFSRNARFSLLLVGGVGIFLWAIAGLPPGALLSSLFAFLLVIPIHILVKTYQTRRKAAFSAGVVTVGTVVEKRTALLGPFHSLVVEYSVGHGILRKARLVPYDLWLQFRVGDRIQVIRSGATLFVLGKD